VTDYRTVNLANWNDRAAAHAASPSYSVRSLIDDPAFLSQVVRFDRPLLGDISGQRGVHLQCHIGTDTVSLSRLGARMTGLDFSDKSLDEARRLAAAAKADIKFVQADVYDALEAVGDGFDLVYTGVGALCWLPDVSRWARTVASLLRPGGRLFIREGHPVLWSVDEEREDSAIALRYSYFGTEEPLISNYEGTYVDTDVAFTHNETHSWNHGIGEVVTAVLEAGMTLTGLVEHTTVPWNALPGKMRDVGDGEYQLIDHPERLPHTYTLQAVV
jgi:SAM-dependent methyltransferase